MHFTAKSGMSDLMSDMTIRLACQGTPFSELSKLTNELNNMTRYNKQLMYICYIAMCKKVAADDKEKNRGKQTQLNFTTVGTGIRLCTGVPHCVVRSCDWSV